MTAKQQGSAFIEAAFVDTAISIQAFGILLKIPFFECSCEDHDRFHKNMYDLFLQNRNNEKPKLYLRYHFIQYIKFTNQ